MRLRPTTQSLSSSSSNSLNMSNLLASLPLSADYKHMNTARRRHLSRLSEQYQNRLGTKITPILYLISFVLIYLYFYSGSSNDTSTPTFDAMDSYIYNYGQSFGDRFTSSNRASSVSYEQFTYSADAIMLPNAPYKHVAETTDLRATQLIYLDAVRQYLKKMKVSGKNKPPQLGFHWKDWVEMHELEPLIKEKPNCFIAGVLGSNVRTAWPGCIDRNSKDAGELNFFFQNPAVVHENEYRLSLRAKTYLHVAAPLPEKLVFLAGELAFVVKSGSKGDLSKNGLLKSFITARIEESNDETITEDDIIRQPITAERILTTIAEELGRDLVDPEGLLIDFAYVSEQEFELLPKKKKSKKSLQAAQANDKHFANVLVEQDGNKFEASYDWRFFQSTLEFSKHREALHHTIRAFLQMTNNLGITAWLSQESLIGWARNGMILPWENVVHFELPAKEMAKLASSFNHSLIIPEPSEISHAYLIDVSPHFMERARKNDGNASPEAPDARFIDTKTGVYIELNGVLSGDGRVPDAIKNEHPEETNRFNFVNSGMGRFYHTSDLSPLKRTLFEGRLAYVPNHAIDIVTADYNDVVTSDVFYNYKYHDHLRLWVPKHKCSYVPQEDITIFEEGGSTYIGACHDDKIWKEYNMTADATRFRYNEIASKVQQPLGSKNELPVLYPDFWLKERVKYLRANYGYADVTS